MDIKDKTLVRVYYDDIKDGIFIIPDGIKKIGNCAFKYCTSLQSILIPDSVEKIGGSAFSGCTSLKDATISSSLTNLADNSFDSSLQNFIVYGQKINQKNFSSELNKIREKELLDKIKFYLENKGILDETYYKYNIHKEFINTIILKYKNNNEYYYKDDFDKYMEEYILKISSMYDDKQMEKMFDSLNNHKVENFDSNDVHSIVTYGTYLENYPNYFTGMLQLIVNHYGIDSSSVNIKKTIDELTKPQNIIQLLSSAFDTYNGGTKYYLNKGAISKLQKFADINVDRLTVGITKAEKLKEAVEIYINKMDKYIKNLLSFEPKQNLSNDIEQTNSISIKEAVNQKLEVYQTNMTVMETFYNQVNNLIESYTDDVIKLKSAQTTLLPGVKIASSLNKGIIRTEKNIEILEEILSCYKAILGLNQEDVIVENNLNEDKLNK